MADKKAAEMIEPLPCIKCGKELEAAMPESTNQPYSGTTFQSDGHYGSTVFDPLAPSAYSRHFIELNVCDECLTRLAQEGKILRGRATQRTKYQYETWDIEKDQSDDGVE